jgi:hypothetical protein
VNKTEHCPVCGSEAHRGWPALVAPFIADFVLQTAVEHCRLLECGTCGLRFFAERFTHAELSRLYADYRGATYYRIRHRHEPWYTARYNGDIGNDSGRARARREGVRTFLCEAGVSGPFESILDYGGDAGQLIPVEMTQHAYVYEISTVVPISGVRKIEKEEDLQQGGYDLVLLSHVLEHTPEPLNLLRKAFHVAREGNGLLYVEVPLERPWMGFIGRGRMTTSYLDLVRRNRILMRFLDFYTTAFRIKVGFLPPFGFSKLHEHINFFSAESLRLAVDRSGFEVLKLGPISTFGKGQPDDSVACLARIK